jgi:hypothetical protein
VQLEACAGLYLPSAVPARQHAHTCAGAMDTGVCVHKTGDGEGGGGEARVTNHAMHTEGRVCVFVCVLCVSVRACECVCEQSSHHQVRSQQA